MFSFLKKMKKSRDKNKKDKGLAADGGNATVATNKLSDETKRLYFTSEFKVLGDMTKDGHLSLEEFYRLMMLLQYMGDRDGCKKIWKAHGKTEGAKLSLDEYIAMMFDPSIQEQTNSWRELFAEIDWDGTGHATRAEVVQGLEKMGLEITPPLRKKLDAMDADKDGRVTYGDFLKQQLKQ